MSKNKF